MIFRFGSCLQNNSAALVPALFAFKVCGGVDGGEAGKFLHKCVLHENIVVIFSPPIYFEFLSFLKGKRGTGFK